MVSSHASSLYNCELPKGRNHVLFMIVLGPLLVLRLRVSHYLNNSTKRIPYHNTKQYPLPSCEPCSYFLSCALGSEETEKEIIK